ncbi:Protein PIR -like protein [Gossypium arboreum]|uniref:Protein PIR-like protein n=1 Tax=Gossypium arboreum TaxID=29729 RepID=A0A0B0NRR3_GOSAR|nr:Protein PIR -like protein [Gossypium arboreum]
MASVLYTYRSCVKALPQGVCWNSQFGIQKLSAETGAALIYCGFWF